MLPYLTAFICFILTAKRSWRPVFEGDN